MRKLSKTQALREIILSEKIPGADVESDEDLLDFARANAETVFHQCGTCRMGNNPLNSVVDEKLKLEVYRVCAWLMLRFSLPYHRAI